MVPGPTGASDNGPPKENRMFAYLTRIAWLVVQPLSVILLLVLAGLVLLWFRRRRLGATAIALAGLLVFLFSFTTFGYLLITPLEARFTRPVEPAHIDGIVVLGGGMDGEVTTARGGWELNRSGDRFVETLRLALRHPEARILIAGGGAALVAEQEPEAVAGRRFFTDFGIAADRILLDDKSRNTEENAGFSRAVASPQAGETWLLVTSAFHMPRAMGLFRKAGFEVVPWPTDYMATGSEGVRIKPDQSTENISISHLALREWTGLAGYYLTGRIDELLPGPSEIEER